jgi:predicted nucleic acid-binding protein
VTGSQENNNFLIDSHLLVYVYNEDSPYHRKAKEIRDKTVLGKLSCCLTPQNLYEFFSIVAYSRKVNNPLSINKALQEIEKYYSSPIEMIYPMETTPLKVMELAKKYRIKRQEIHDIHLLATMIENEVFYIYTRNDTHFHKFEEIEVVNPFV